MTVALDHITGIIGWLLAGLSVLGTLYTVAAAVTLRRFFARRQAVVARLRRQAVVARLRRQAVVARHEGVTLVKPLHGAEPRLADNLAGFLDQDHHGPIQLLCGVQRADDPAIAVVEALAARFPAVRVDLVIDPANHGANRKVANLINLQPHIAHDTVIMSDSDMVVGPGYLAMLLAALDQPGTGAVTLAYNGRGDAGWWSKLAAAGLSWQFLPGAVFGAATGLAHPCMGSTIALRRETLTAIGGMRAFADVLADDYAIGQSVAALGLNVVVAPLLVTHASTERDFAALWRHELRWGATVRDLVPTSYALGVIAMPLPLALLAMAIHPVAGVACAALALVARTGAATIADRLGNARTAPLWLLPLRDCLTFVVFIASWVVRSVDWRGATLRMETQGRVSAVPEVPVS
jgi:ceramide glucosyltransferase